MDHSHVELASLIDRYVRGRMLSGERMAFEEHFLDCPDCLGQLEIARSFMEGVRIAATEAAAAAEHPKATRRSLGAWLTGLGFWRAAELVAATCLIALIVPVTLVMKRSANEVPAVFVLNEVRGPETALDGPANRITIPKSSRWIVLAVERDFSQYRRYRAVVETRDGKTVWQQDNLAPSSPDAIGISFPSEVLKTGDYTVDLAAFSPAGQFVPLAKYSFSAAE